MKPNHLARRVALVCAVATAAALALTSCAPSAAPASTSLTWALVSAPQSLDNTKAISAVSYTVQAAALETLAHVENDGTVVPWLATEWSNPDPTTYVFTLRDDVTFWNGDPMTADDVAFSLNRVAEDTSLISYNFAAMKEATVTGDNEVTVTLTDVDPLFLSIGIATNGFIVQKAFVDEAGDAFGDPEALTMGTGPFQVESFSKTADTVLTRYDGYWGDAPGADSLTFQTISDAETMRIALTEGQVDGTFDASLSDGDRYESSDAVQTLYAPGLAMEYLSLDTREAPFDDVHVRKAIALAVNKADLVTAQLGGHGAPNETGLTALQLDAQFGEGGQELLDQIEVYPFDVDAAKAELAQSAYPDGFTTAVTFAEYDNVVFQVLQENLKAIGITLEGKPVPAEQFYAESAAIDQPQGMRPIYTGYGSFDGGESLGNILGASNTSGYSSAVTVKELDALRTELDPDARKASIVAISQDLASNVPIVPLYTEDRMLILGTGWTYDDWAPRGSDWIQRVHAAN